jgi:eukaryotic-like serine/threonine-protein kinase
MPLVYLCLREHCWIPDTPDRPSGDRPAEPCIACGADATLQDLPWDDEKRPVIAPPGYDLLGPVHGGALSRVFKARHRPSRRLVALKLSCLGPDAEPGTRGAIRREARVLAELDHPHIVRLVDAGEAGGRAFVATEWLPGGTLARRLSGGPLPAREAVDLVARLGDAVDHLHSRRFLHLDLRPLNIVLRRRGEPKLVDLGGARRLDRPGGRARRGWGGGDPRYMAPEQAAEPRRAPGPAADIHALGAILYQALAGRPPYRGIPLDERLRPSRVRIPPPGALRPSLPAALDRICERCLHHEPKDRYARVAELADDLRHVFGGPDGAPRGSSYLMPLGEFRADL